MLKMEYKTSLFILLLLSCLLLYVSPVRIPQNPCPRIFSYYKDAKGLLYGETNIPYDKATFMTLSINASLAGRFSNKVELKLQLKTALKQLMANVSTVTYNIFFPSQEIIPKITQITYNGNVFCQGPPEPLIPGTQGITNLWYSTMFQFTRIPEWNLIQEYQDPGIPESEIPVKDPDDNILDTRIPVVQKRPTDTSEENNVSYGEYPSMSSLSTPTPQEVVSQLPTVVTSTSEVEKLSYKCGIPKPSIRPLILGGTDSAVGQFPWLVALMSKNDSSDEYEYKCSATLISHKHVVTAGRCVQYYRLQVLKIQDMLLVMGTNDVTNWEANGAVSRRVIKVNTHPDFMRNPNSAHADISVVTMDNQVSFSDFLIPVCLWMEDTDLYPVTNKVGTVAGYGQDEIARKNGALHVSHAMYADMKIVSQYDCLLSEIGLLQITSDKTFCADGASKGPCIGDSGSGFVLHSNGVYQLRGISSYAVTRNGTCDLENKYAVFCDVAKFSKWVESCMQN
ncbi:unnamed protein product [Phaedon cochleariae]|uniref:Peptidase S1 domain-containing protein n=1 Tax=Phaedon cochleariae TaxID=80249 RepID=A0A9N9SKE6_PHACE|nr:unnamed protein product [Phaedon cochleariae]